MVGFGSSLRMGRRPGWEGAYLDYETLKLLLSQIEAVYEEHNAYSNSVSSAAALSAAVGVVGDSSSQSNLYGQYSHSFLSNQHHHYHQDDGNTSGRDASGGSDDDAMDAAERGGGGARRAGGGRRRRKAGPVDYRDQLFLESDSDAAFASDSAHFGAFRDVDESSSEDDDEHADDNDDYFDVNNRSYFDGGEIVNSNFTEFGVGGGPGQTPHRHTESGVNFGGFNNQQLHQPFLTYSAQAGYSSSEESGSDTVGVDRCGGVPWRKEKKSPTLKTKIKSVAPSTKKKKKKNRRRHSHGHHGRNHAPTIYDEDDYFPTHRPAGPSTFIIAEESGSGYVEFGDSTGLGDEDNNDDKRLSFDFTNTSDQASILPTLQSLPLSSAALNSSMDATASDGSIGGVGFTDTNFVTSGLMGFSSNPNTIFQPSILPPASSPASAGLLIRNNCSNDRQTPRMRNKVEKKHDKKEEAKRRERRAQQARRRQRLAQLRKQRDRKVPPTLRLAHAKSRAITGRFLGLLRAEVEKVVLFAQARLGELADTAGGLRFMSSEELTELGEQGIARSAKSSYDYSFQMDHPSASSSSDEGLGTLGGSLPWSDSSSDEESKASGRQRSSVVLPGTASITSPSALTSNSEGQRNRRGPISENQEKLEATIRKINQFEVARKKRPIFNRNVDILGDELLLMSAVDEADAYAAVGVELLHVLRFICINTIAVRKLIRKHDRLLMNRMLGGYYHRERSRRGQENMTLGGLVAHVSGDVYEAHPALVNHGKLSGVFDMKIQQLANSRTVKVISSCLALALSEYEVSRNRADALAKLNPAPKITKRMDGDDSESRKSRSVYTLGTMALSTATSWVKGERGRDEETLVSSLHDHDIYPPSDNESEDGPPSTTSSLSLSRLQYTVLTIAALREAARNKFSPYSVYVCRGILSFTGRAPVGAGLDGCSRESLDAILTFNPDAPLLLDPSAIYEGLKLGQWRQQPVESVMTSSLAVALSFPNAGTLVAPVKILPQTIRDNEDVISGSFSILPKKSEELDSRSPFDSHPLSIFLSISRFVPFPSFLLRGNRMSCFLYTMNYFVVHPTAVPFVLETTANTAYSAIIIGAPAASAILISMIHCRILCDHTCLGRKPSRESLALFRNLFLFSAFAAVLGNIVQARGMAHESIPHTVLGRFLLGFSSSEIVQRQFIASLMPLPLIAPESARLSHVQIVGQLIGLLFGSLVAWSGVLVVSQWFMMTGWIAYMIYIVCGDISDGRYADSTEIDVDGEIVENKNIDDSIGGQSDSSGSDQETGPAQLFQRSSYMDETEGDAEGEIAGEKTGLLVSKVPPEQPKLTNRMKCSNPFKVTLKRLRTFIKRIQKLMAFNISIPVTLAFIFYCRFSIESFVSSSPLLVYHYFDWTGQSSGCFLAFLSLLLAPTDVFSEQIARRYEERILLKRGIVVLGVGLFVMINWESIFGLLPKIQNLLDEDDRIRRHDYDWFLGILQYVGGLTLSIVALRSMDVASCSLLSKVAPPDIRRIALNVGTIATFVGLVAQVSADLQIAAIVLSHRLINSDVVNALAIPILLVSFLASYFVRKHYFFLM